jgi:hypothetical protein
LLVGGAHCNNIVKGHIAGHVGIAFCIEIVIVDLLVSCSSHDQDASVVEALQGMAVSLCSVLLFVACIPATFDLGLDAGSVSYLQGTGAVGFCTHVQAKNGTSVSSLGNLEACTHRQSSSQLASTQSIKIQQT